MVYNEIMNRFFFLFFRGSYSRSLVLLRVVVSFNLILILELHFNNYSTILEPTVLDRGA